MATGGGQTFATPLPKDPVMTSLTNCPHCGSLCLGPIVLSCGHVLCRKCVHHNVLQLMTAGCLKCQKPLGYLPRGLQALTVNGLCQEMSSDPVMEHLVLQELKRKEDMRCLNCQPPQMAANVCLDCQDCFCEACSLNHLKAHNGRDHVLLGLPQAAAVSGALSTVSNTTHRPGSSSDLTASPMDGIEDQQSPGVSHDESRVVEGWMKKEMGGFELSLSELQELETTLQDIVSLGQQLTRTVRAHKQVLLTYQHHLSCIDVTHSTKPGSYVVKIRSSDVSMNMKTESMERRLCDVRKHDHCPSIGALRRVRKQLTGLLGSAGKEESSDPVFFEPKKPQTASSTQASITTTTTTTTPQTPAFQDDTTLPSPTTTTTATPHTPAFHDDTTLPSPTTTITATPQTPAFHDDTTLPSTTTTTTPQTPAFHDDTTFPSTTTTTTPQTPAFHDDTTRPSTTTTTTPQTPALHDDTTPSFTPQLDFMTATPEIVHQLSSFHDGYRLSVIAIVCLSDDRLVMTDRCSRRLKVMDATPPHDLSDSPIIFEGPRGLAVLPDGLLGLTTCLNIIYLLKVTDTVSVESRVKTTRQYDGIAGLRGGHLVVSSLQSHEASAFVDVVSRQGRRIRSISTINSLVLRRPEYLCLSGDPQHVLLSDNMLNVLHEINVRSGEVTQTFRRRNIKNPHQVCVDNDGNMFVACVDSQCVMVRNRAGKWRKLLKGSRHGGSWLTRPRGVCMTNSGYLVVVWGKDVLSESMVISYKFT
ncbi:hypothetical protein ACOMHN_043269 [Nucella lapillus]